MEHQQQVAGGIASKGTAEGRSAVQQDGGIVHQQQTVPFTGDNAPAHPEGQAFFRQDTRTQAECRQKRGQSHQGCSLGHGPASSVKHRVHSTFSAASDQAPAPSLRAAQSPPKLT